MEVAALKFDKCSLTHTRCQTAASTFVSLRCQVSRASCRSPISKGPSAVIGQRPAKISASSPREMCVLWSWSPGWSRLHHELIRLSTFRCSEILKGVFNIWSETYFLYTTRLICDIIPNTKMNKRDEEERKPVYRFLSLLFPLNNPHPQTKPTTTNLLFTPQKKIY